MRQPETNLTLRAPHDPDHAVSRGASRQEPHARVQTASPPVARTRTVGFRGRSNIARLTCGPVPVALVASQGLLTITLTGAAGRGYTHRLLLTVVLAENVVALLLRHRHPLLLDSVCAAAALRLENERLQAELRARLGELQASRARLVDATEAERRRIERDLHDGTQQRLVSLAMSLGLLDSKLPTDPDTAKPIAQEARQALAVALEELRELSQGIHPAVVTERGLAAALEELADRSSLPAYLDVSIAERLSPAVEAAAYFVVSEALTNAAKHSHAGEVRIAASRKHDLLMVEVADDGIGGAALQGGPAWSHRPGRGAGRAADGL